jgi:sugar/nucleoside kinase (ribokinase family)
MAIQRAMKSWDVIVIGEVFVDHVMSGFTSWPKPGEEVFCEHYTREIGGGAAITSCALARLGRSVQLLAVIGSFDGAWLEQRLKYFGVTVAGLRKVDGWTGTTLSVSTREDRSFFTHAGANTHLHRELRRRDTLEKLTQARHVHFAMPLPGMLGERVLPLLREAGTTVSLDVGFRPEWFGDPNNASICQSVDYLLPNEKEAGLMCGSEDPREYFAFARKQQFRAPVLKLGARGAMSVDGDAIHGVPPPPVDAIDSTGAGDAFDAGFIDAVLDAAKPQECLRRGCICGALSTRVAGALGAIPDSEELWKVYEQTYES